MKKILSEQQTAFYTKNGYIELEIPHPTPEHLQRDQWREDPKLQDFLTRKIGPLALVLTGKKTLRLACDQLFTEANRPAKQGLLKELFCIQGFELAIAIAKEPIIPAKRSQLGILPMPSMKEYVLFFKPQLLLDWPHVKSDVYIALYALPNAVYIHNPNDPATNQLKQYGYHFGDILKNEFHPQIVKE